MPGGLGRVACSLPHRARRSQLLCLLRCCGGGGLAAGSPWVGRPGVLTLLWPFQPVCVGVVSLWGCHMQRRASPNRSAHTIPKAASESMPSKGGEQVTRKGRHLKRGREDSWEAKGRVRTRSGPTTRGDAAHRPGSRAGPHSRRALNRRDTMLCCPLDNNACRLASRGRELISQTVIKLDSGEKQRRTGSGRRRGRSKLWRRMAGAPVRQLACTSAWRRLACSKGRARTAL